MKSIYNKDQRLESHKFFPIIAWTLVLAFSYFVYTIVQDLQTTAQKLNATSQRLEEISAMQVTDIKDFNH